MTTTLQITNISTTTHALLKSDDGFNFSVIIIIVIGVIILICSGLACYLFCPCGTQTIIQRGSLLFQDSVDAIVSSINRMSTDSFESDSSSSEDSHADDAWRGARRGSIIRFGSTENIGSTENEKKTEHELPDRRFVSFRNSSEELFSSEVNSNNQDAVVSDYYVAPKVKKMRPPRSSGTVNMVRSPQFSSSTVNTVRSPRSVEVNDLVQSLGPGETLDYADEEIRSLSSLRAEYVPVMRRNQTRRSLKPRLGTSSEAVLDRLMADEGVLTLTELKAKWGDAKLKHEYMKRRGLI